jgi:hypothetical protein
LGWGSRPSCRWCPSAVECRPNRLSELGLHQRRSFSTESLIPVASLKLRRVGEQIRDTTRIPTTEERPAPSGLCSRCSQHRAFRDETALWIVGDIGGQAREPRERSTAPGASQHNGPPAVSRAADAALLVRHRTALAARRPRPGSTSVLYALSAQNPGRARPGAIVRIVRNVRKRPLDERRGPGQHVSAGTEAGLVRSTRPHFARM